MLILDFDRSFVVNFICGMLNDISFLMILSFISVSVPGYARMIQQIMFQIVYLDLLQTDKWLPGLLFSEESLSKDEGLNEFFGLNGLDSTKLLINLGSTLIFMLVFIQIHFSLPLIDRIVPRSFFK